MLERLKLNSITIKRIIFFWLGCVGIGWLAFTPSVSAVMQGNGQIVYNKSGIATPASREWRSQENTWTAQTNLSSNSSNGTNVIVKASPTRNEVMAGTVNASGVLRVYKWDGSSWTGQWSTTIGTTTGSTLPRYSIVYQSSGNAVIIYSRNAATSSQLAYRVWNGSAWAGPNNYTTIRTTGIVDYVVAKGRSGTNEVIVAWADRNRSVSAIYINGNTFGSEPSAAITTNLARMSTSATQFQSAALDVAFEDQSGRALIAYGTDSASTASYAIRSAGSSGTWGTSATLSSQSRGLSMSLMTQPGTDTIMWINHSNTNTSGTAADIIDAAGWDGSNWTGIDAPRTAIPLVASEHDVSVSWFQSGQTSRALLIYNGTDSPGDIHYFSYDPAAKTFAASQTAEFSATTTVSDIALLRVYTNPFNNSTGMALTIVPNSGTTGSLFTTKVSFDGSSFSWVSTQPSSAALDTTLPTNIGGLGWLSDYTYNRYVPPANLSVDIVSSGGVAVTAPSVTFNPLSASTSCQSSSAVMGDSTNQRIRVSNTTTNPQWTLTIAPTNGSSSNWSSGTDNYDFNDRANSGCSDGTDNDTTAGLMTISPSSGTLTTSGRVGCTTTNVSRGSSTSFSEGTVDSITLATGLSAAQVDCNWDMYSIPVSQKIPASQPPGDYSLPMTLTVTAS